MPRGQEIVYFLWGSLQRQLLAKLYTSNVYQYDPFHADETARPSLREVEGVVEDYCSLIMFLPFLRMRKGEHNKKGTKVLSAKKQISLSFA